MGSESRKYRNYKGSFSGSGQGGVVVLSPSLQPRGGLYAAALLGSRSDLPNLHQRPGQHRLRSADTIA